MYKSSKITAQQIEIYFVILTLKFCTENLLESAE